MHTKTKPVKNRAVKFIINEDTANYLRNSIVSHIDPVNDIVYKSLSNNEHKNEHGRNKFLLSYRDDLISKNKDLLSKNGICPSTWRRSLFSYIIERYYGYEKRHKSSLKKMSLKDASVVRLQSGLINIKDNKTISYKPIDGSERREASIQCLGTMYKYIPHIGKDCGGNLLDNNIFVARAKVPYDYLYQPINVVGIDINMRSEVFVVIADENSNHISTLARNEQLNNLIDIQDQINKEIDNKNRKLLRSKQRRRRRLKLGKIRKKIEKEILESYVKPIIHLAKKRYALLCIDESHTGAKNGNYGQEHLIKLLIKYCENWKIPFVVVPTRWTTKLCKCGKLGERQDNETFACNDCGEMDADIHGASNVARFGKYMWIHGEDRLKQWVNRRPTSKAVRYVQPV